MLRLSEAPAIGASGAFPDALPGLTTIRFALALGVVLFHYHLQWSFPDVAFTGLFERARLGVDAFFILSGLILTHVYDRELRESRFDYAHFLIARVARIFPLHLAAVSFMVALVMGAALLGAEFDRDAYRPYALFRTAFLIQSWLPAPERAQFNWNGPSWSLSAEWFAYVFFPAFAWVGLKLRQRPVVLLALAVGVFVLFDAAYRDSFGRILPHAEENLGVMRIAPEFLYGIALYRLGQRVRLDRRAATLACTAAALVLVALMHLRADDRLIVAAQGIVLLTVALLSKAGADRWLATRALTFLGEVSFALYLVHMPLLILWKNAAAELTGQPSDYVMSFAELAILFPITMSVAIAAHLGIEVPARNAIRRRIDRRPVPAAGPTALR